VFHRVRQYAMVLAAFATTVHKPGLGTATIVCDILALIVIAMLSVKAMAMLDGMVRLIRSGPSLVRQIEDDHLSNVAIGSILLEWRPVERSIARISYPPLRLAMQGIFNGVGAVTVGMSTTMALFSTDRVTGGLLLTLGIMTATCAFLLLIFAVLRRLVLGQFDLRTDDIQVPNVLGFRNWQVHRDGSNAAIYFMALVYVNASGFAALYASLARVGVGSFSHVDASSNALSWIYFSVVTLSTVGYGDVHPVNTIGQLAVLLQLTSGPLLLTWLVATLLGSRAPET